MWDDLYIVPQATVVLFCDNNSALHLAVNPVFMSLPNTLKWIDMWLEKRFHHNVLRLLPINTTKSLIPKLFLHLLSKMGLIDLYAPS